MFDKSELCSANDRSLSINCGFGPDTGKLRFFSSAFKSLTFKSSRFRNERVSIICGRLLMTWADVVDDADDGADDGEDDEDDDDDTVEDCSTIDEVDLCGGAGSMS